MIRPARRPTLLSDAQRIDWIRLIRTKNVGPHTFRELINRFGGAGAALKYLPELADRGGARRTLSIFSEKDAQAELQAVRAAGGEIVSPGEPGYPTLLAQVDNPPPVLSVLGFRDIADKPMIAIVGSRNSSLGGCQLARKVANELGASGFVIVSGCARGIDTHAHRGALKTGTVAFFAGGLNRIYPEENRELVGQIVKLNGLIVAEKPWSSPPRSQDFPRRNRLIGGSSFGTLVVEAARRSGSLITAQLAAEQGRLVFAVPGSPLDPRSEGPNYLIREGATLARSAEDILEAVAPMLAPHHATAIRQTPPALRAPDPEPPENFGDDARTELDNAMSVTPISIDELVRGTGLSVSQIQIAILEWELAGRLVRHGSQKISLIPHKQHASDIQK